MIVVKGRSARREQSWPQDLNCSSLHLPNIEQPLARQAEKEERRLLVENDRR
jgi:hypothetical protein